MPKKTYAMLFALLLGLDTSANAVETISVTGKLTRIITHGSSYIPYTENTDGVTAFYIEGLPKACGNGIERVAIGAGHPIHDTAVSLALAAHATGKTVTMIYLNTCTVRSNAWDYGFMYLNEN